MEGGPWGGHLSCPRSGPWKGSRRWSMEGVQEVVHGLGVSVFNSPSVPTSSDFDGVYNEISNSLLASDIGDNGFFVRFVPLSWKLTHQSTQFAAGIHCPFLHVQLTDLYNECLSLLRHFWIPLCPC